MRELLSDNMVLVEKLKALPLCLGNPSKHAELREIGSRLTWVLSFATYVAIVSGAHPDWVADILAYIRLIIREAHKHGGQGWLTYDTVFRHNHQGTSQWWNVLDPALHMAYIAGQGSATKVSCRHCNEADHATEDCALAPMTPSARPSPSDRLLIALCTLRCPQPSYPPLPATKKLCIS